MTPCWSASGSAAWSGRLYDRQGLQPRGRPSRRQRQRRALQQVPAAQGRLRRAHRDHERLPDESLRSDASLGRPGRPASHRRQLRALHRADGRLARAHGPRTRPFHRGLRRQHRPGPARPRQAVSHRGLSLEGKPPGPVRSDRGRPRGGAVGDRVRTAARALARRRTGCDLRRAAAPGLERARLRRPEARAGLRKAAAQEARRRREPLHLHCHQARRRLPHAAPGEPDGS